MHTLVVPGPEVGVRKCRGVAGWEESPRVIMPGHKAGIHGRVEDSEDHSHHNEAAVVVAVDIVIEDDIDLAMERQHMGLLVEEHNRTEAVVTVAVGLGTEDGAHHIGLMMEGQHVGVLVEEQHISLVAEGIDLILEGLHKEVLFFWLAILKPSSRCANTHG